MQLEQDITSLVRKAQQGDQQALQNIYLTEYKQVYYLAFSLLQDSGVAEDVAQETFITAFQHIDQLQNPLALHHWILSIASNKCRDKMRKKQELPVEQEQLFETMEEEESILLPDNALDDDETRKMILGVIHSLPEKQRQTVLYYYYSQLTVLQVAELMECSEGTVKSRLSTARQSIRAELERMNREDGIKLYSGAPLALLPVLQQAAQNIQLPAGALENGWAVLQAAVSLPIIPYQVGQASYVAAQMPTSAAKGLSAGKLAAAITASILAVAISVGTAGTLWVNSRSASHMTTSIVQSMATDVSDVALPAEITKWTVEPFLEAENIRPLIYYLDEEDSKDENFRLSTRNDYYQQVSIVEKNGLFGLISFTGEYILTEQNANIFYLAEEAKIAVIAKELSADEDPFSVEMYYLLDDNYYFYGEPTFDFQVTSQSQYFWDENRKNVTHWYITDAGLANQAEDILSDTIPVPVCPVTRKSVALTGEEYYEYPPERLLGYALNDQYLIEAKYVKAQFVWEGIAAVSEDGTNWFYTTMEGRILNDIPYSSVNAEEIQRGFEKENLSLRYYISYDYAQKESYYCAYDFSEGLVAVNREGLWGYMDKNGAEVIPCQYEATRPVYKGMAWVKVDGLWGVANLSDYVS